MRQAGRARRDRRWDAAIRQLESASAYARTDAERLEARLLLAEIHLDASHPREAVDALERVLLDARLRPLPVATDDGRRTDPRRPHGGRSAGRDRPPPRPRLLRRLRSHRPRRCSSGARRSAIRTCSRRSCRDYPVAVVVPDALLELGALLRILGAARRGGPRLQAAARRGARRAGAGRGHLVDGAGLRRAQAAMSRPGTPISSWLRGIPGCGWSRQVPTVAEAVAAKLAGEPYARLLADRPPARRSPRRCSAGGTGRPADARSVRALSAEGVVPSLEASRIVLGCRDTLRLLDAVRRRLAMVGGAGLGRRVGGLPGRQAHRGRPAPGRGPGPGHGVRPVAIPTGRSGEGCGPARSVRRRRRRARRAARAAAGTSTTFRLVKGRVFCLRGADELVALRRRHRGRRLVVRRAAGRRSTRTSGSAPSGSCSRSTGPISSWCCGPRTASPSRGRPWATSETGSSGRPCRWTTTRVLVVLDPRTVKKLDLNTGQIVWEYRESEEMPVNGAAAADGRRRAGAGAPRRPDADPPRPGDRLEAVVAARWAWKT